jgi:hypothetical protein
MPIIVLNASMKILKKLMEQAVLILVLWGIMEIINYNNALFFLRL